MPKEVVIVDCYCVEPAGLGVPPYISTYVRYAYACFHRLGYKIHYVTIDDFRLAERLCDAPITSEGYTNPYAYSLTKNGNNIIDILKRAEWVILISGDTVPSKHVQAVNASADEVKLITSLVKGKCILLGPLSFSAIDKSHFLHNEFVAFHTHAISTTNFTKTSLEPPSYEELGNLITDFSDLLDQIPWQVVAEIELYRGCTRDKFCSFCFEPIKNKHVVYRDVQDIIHEVRVLYLAGARRFRLGQQACFFSYKRRNVYEITRLLVGIREACPDIKVLHIDNVDPLAAASPVGREIANIVCQYCTPGNCAAMGIETFDLNVISSNQLICTPEILIRAMSNIEEYGTQRSENGVCFFLPGLNIIYGLSGETSKTHEENLRWLGKIYKEGHHAHRTNIRQVSIFQGTSLAQHQQKCVTSAEQLETRKKEISEIYEIPMKKRVYPSGLILKNQHAFFRDASGTWFRAYGSYPIMTLVENKSYPLYEERDIVITNHSSRHIFGQVV